MSNTTMIFTEPKLMTASEVKAAMSYPYVAYDLTPEAKKMLAEFIDRRVEELQAKETKTNKTETKKETTMKENNTMKNVLFLAPGWAYAQTVIASESKELDRKGIPYTSSKITGNLYIRTDKVNVKIICNDPIKWTPDLFYKRDAVFGKKELIQKAQEMFPTTVVRRSKVSLSKYIREAHIDDTCPDPVKPRETYIPEIKNVYFNDPVTVVIWEDGTKTMVRCQPDDVYSAETGLALCIAKKALGNMPNFNNVFRKWIPEEERPLNIVMEFDYTPGVSECAEDLLSRVKNTIQ